MEESTVSWVFHYGVFQRDAVGFERIRPFVKKVERAKMSGRLYQLPTGLPVVLEGEGIVWGDLFDFGEKLPMVLRLMDEHEGFDAQDVEGSYQRRVVREAEISATGEKVQAFTWIFPTERFNEREMHAVFAHGGDWRKFVMMPRSDGYAH